MGDFPVGRPESLDDFLPVRQARSAPGSKIEEVQVDGILDATRPVEPARAAAVPCITQICPAEAMPERSVLDLASLLARPQLGSAELPTLGSATHHLRQCKPCAFFWKG